LLAKPIVYYHIGINTWFLLNCMWVFLIFVHNLEPCNIKFFSDIFTAGAPELGISFAAGTDLTSWKIWNFIKKTYSSREIRSVSFFLLNALNCYWKISGNFVHFMHDVLTMLKLDSLPGCWSWRRCQTMQPYYEK
jgi:hypothetical protein